MKVMIDPNLPLSPKLRKLAESLRLGVPEALGHLIAMWSAVVSQREDGVLRGWSKGDVEYAAGWNKRRGIGRLVKALIEQGWLDESKTGELSIHDWEEHQGNIIGERSAEAAKKRRQRAHAKGIHCADCPQGCPGTLSPLSRPPSPPLPVPSLPLHALPIHTKPGEGESPRPVARVLANTWNQGPGCHLNGDKAVEHIQCALHVGVEPQAIEQAFLHHINVKGKKIWEVLDPLRPKNGQAGTGYVPKSWDQILKEWGEKKAEEEKNALQ